MSINYKPSLTYFGKQSQNFQHPYFSSRRGKHTFKNTANILYKHTLSSRVNFTTGIEYSQQGQRINFNADSASGNNMQILKLELNYFRIPFTIGYSIWRTTISDLQIYSGISFGLVAKRKDNYQDLILERINLPTAEERYRNHDWAVPLGINYKRELTSSFSFSIGVEFLFGLTNAFSENAGSKFGVLSEFKNSKQRRLALNTGFCYNIAD